MNSGYRSSSPSPTSRTGVKPIKAFANSGFLQSRNARNIRILCEYQETLERLENEHVSATVMVFGSARCYAREEWKQLYDVAMKNLKEAGPSESQECLEKLNQLERIEWLCEYYEKTRELARMITEWAVDPVNAKYVNRIGDTNNHLMHQYQNESLNDSDSEFRKVPLVVCTGGGPGLMEAANRGAQEVPGGRSMGMGITLPFEASLNPYVTEELGFEFHYFFTRKFWMIFCTLALVATPGGYGTMDELFEVLTLKQTKKIKKNIPVILFGREYWTNVMNFPYMVKMGVISQKDIDQLFITDSVQDAFDRIIDYLKSDEAIIAKPFLGKKM